MNGTKTGSSHCKVSSVTLMRRLSSNSRKNQIYKAFREVGRVMRTVALLRFLADSGLRARVTAATNKAEAYNGFSAWTPVRQPARDRRERPGRAGKSVKWNSLLCNLIVFPHRDRHDGGHPAAGCRGVAAEDLAQLSPYLTSHILRFGAYSNRRTPHPAGRVRPRAGRGRLWRRNYTRPYWDQIGATLVGRHVFDITTAGVGSLQPGSTTWSS